MQAVVLAAGKGTRINSDVPKVLHEVLGKSILEHVLLILQKAGVKRSYVVVGSGARDVCSLLRRKKLSSDAIYQRTQLGTGHAVMMCEKVLKKTRGDVLICPGDMP